MKKDANELTPMQQQYMAAKKEYPDAILFFRLGDFYEMFFEDAVTAARELNLTLTSRHGDTDKNPMCGIPYHAYEPYLTKLVAKGYKVAIAEQIGDPKAKGLTERKVIKVVTPGTILSENALKSAQNNYIALLYEAGNNADFNDTGLVLAGADISTGECFYGIYRGEDAVQLLLDELYRIMMPELLILGNLSANLDKKLKEFLDLRLGNCSITKLPDSIENVQDIIIQHFDSKNRPDGEIAEIAVANLLGYLHETVKTDLSHISSLNRLDVAEKLVLDTYTLRNLEITRNLRDGGRKDTLISVLDFTETAMGTRLLKKWLESPLVQEKLIIERQDAVEELVNTFALREELQTKLHEIYDFERLLTRIEVGSANARDMLALKCSLRALPEVKSILNNVKSDLLNKCQNNINIYQDLVDLLEKSIDENPGLTIRDGGIIKDGYNQDLDEYRTISRDSKKLLQEMEEKEKETTGIRSLKIGYNKVFGYYIEVRNSGTDMVPAHYVRKQTLANAERYITDELKQFETKILGAEEKIVSLEYNLFMEIREKVKARLSEIQATARELAVIDVLTGFAEAASRYNYVRPWIAANGQIDIKDGRHPLVERLLTREMFVPNNTLLNHNENEIMLITGPNMAGKSTYMRQTALIVLMAQTGCFVPAREAVISPVDRIFTRIGASDDLASGQSTFMVEMNEVAQILKYATRDSLVILDEIGRGTSTFDGMSIARAVMEHIEKKIHAKTMFATHYHELTDLADDKIKNYCIAVKEKGTDVTFLRRIIPGAADKSYGIHVARLAGLPKTVTARAEKILKGLEDENGIIKTADKADKVAEAPADFGMGSLFGSHLNDELLKLDVMTMTPLEAINKLYELQQKAKDNMGMS